MAKVMPVPVEALRDNLAEHVRQAEGGDRIVVTFHGKAIAGLVPVSDLEKVAGKLDVPKRIKPARK